MMPGMVELEWSITGEQGRRRVACVDTAASAVLGVFGSIIGAYPMEALAEVMTNVGAPTWRAIVTDGRDALSRCGEWHYTSGAVRVRMRTVPTA